MPDWKKFREIADSVGAILLADISHIAGMVAAGAVPSPVGYAHVITFTTHKTLCGPRGACILTTDPAIGRKIDRSIFPGEQGGPHVHVMAALALTFKLARPRIQRTCNSRSFKNCAALIDQLPTARFPRALQRRGYPPDEPGLQICGRSGWHHPIRRYGCPNSGSGRYCLQPKHHPGR